MSKHIQTGQQRGGSPIVFKSGVPVSVICVASTFTSLSYTNNGGKVQITSSGVHGLTTSPAVGASVYVSWSGGTGVSGLYTVLSVDSTTAFTINLAYTAGLGIPSVARVNVIIKIPIGYKNISLGVSSQVFCDFAVSITASSAAKEIYLYNSATEVIHYIYTASATGKSIRNQALRILNYSNIDGSKYIYDLSYAGTSTTDVRTRSISGSIIPAFIGLTTSVANEVLTLAGYNTEVYI